MIDNCIYNVYEAILASCLLVGAHYVSGGLKFGVIIHVLHSFYGCECLIKL